MRQSSALVRQILRGHHVLRLRNPLNFRVNPWWLVSCYSDHQHVERASMRRHLQGMQTRGAGRGHSHAHRALHVARSGNSSRDQSHARAAHPGDDGGARGTRAGRVVALCRSVDTSRAPVSLVMATTEFDLQPGRMRTSTAAALFRSVGNCPRSSGTGEPAFVYAPSRERLGRDRGGRGQRGSGCRGLRRRARRAASVGPREGPAHSAGRQHPL
jgi:hypothetical protein